MLMAAFGAMTVELGQQQQQQQYSNDAA